MTNLQYLQPPRPVSPQAFELAPFRQVGASSSAVQSISRPSSRAGTIRSRPSSPRPPSSVCPSPSQQITPLPIVNTAEPLTGGTPTLRDECRTPERPADADAGHAGEGGNCCGVPPQPCSPADVQRCMYERKHVVPRAGTTGNQISNLPAMELRYDRSPNATVDNWEILVHPEGRMYYQRLCKTVFTNSNLSDGGNKLCAETAATQIKEKLSKFPNTPEDTIVVLELRPDDGLVFYYCISWEKRRVYWPVGVEISMLSAYERPVYDLSHAALKNEAMFWLHAQMFPHCGIVRTMTQELKDILNSGYMDTMTSDTSTVPYDSKKLLNMIRSVDNLRDEDDNTHKVWVVARLLETFYKDRFLNYHGQLGAKLNADDAIHELSNVRPRSVFFRLMSPWLFWWPSVYLREVEDIWVDQTVREIHWIRFISELREDWERSATPATVLLTANVSFLAIQSIDMGHGTNARSVAQIASYASTMLSLTNYIACQILLRQHRKTTKDSAKYARDYLVRQEDNKFGLETMAIAFSLPHVLFVWSILTFLFSICWVFFWQTNISTRAVLGILLVFLFVLISLVLFLGWHPSTPDDFTHRHRLQRVPWKLDGWKLSFKLMSRLSGHRSPGKHDDLELGACAPSSDGDSQVTAV